MKFGDRIKQTVTSAKEKISDHKTSSRLKHSDLCDYTEAWKLVYPEFEKAIGRENWHKPAENQTFLEYKEQISNYLQRIWPDDYNPRELEGSVAAIFNLLVIYLVCLLNLECDKKKFMNSLSWAIDQASMVDLWSYFTMNVFADNTDGENLRTLLPKYMNSSFPDLSPEESIKLVDQKLSRFETLQSSKVALLYHSEGLSNSVIDEGSGPKGSIKRYIEMYSPEYLEKVYIAPLFGLHSSLKPNPNETSVDWLFCDDGVILVPAKNNRQKPLWLPSEGFQQLLFGLAYDALTENGVAKYENYKLFMYSQIQGRESNILYRYLGSSREKAFVSLQKLQNNVFPLLAEYYPVEWTEEVIDESSHYTRTTTTYWTWG